MRRGLTVTGIAIGTLLLLSPAVRLRAQTVGYPVVYVAAPRLSDTAPPPMADVFQPYSLTGNSDLRVHYPDGRDELIVDASATQAIADPAVTLDGTAVLYTRCARVTELRDDLGAIGVGGCDIERVDVATKTITVLTHQEREPNTSLAGTPQGGAQYPVYNGGPWQLSDGRIVFTSNRRNLYPPKGYGQIVSQLYVMNPDGSDAHNIMPMSLAGVLHPFQLTDGRIAFASQESQGQHDPRVWAIWASYPDGRHWEPLVSAFLESNTFHFATQLSDGHLVYEAYYNLNNFGFGAFFAQPLDTPAPRFGPADGTKNAPRQYSLQCGQPFTSQAAFTWKGAYALTRWTNFVDQASPAANPGDCSNPNTVRVGKVAHPAAAPNGALLMAYSGGPVNRLPRPVATPAPQSGIYIAPNAITFSPNELIRVVDEPNVNEIQPRPLVAYSAIYGAAAPTVIPFEPNDGSVHTSLPVGTAYGLIGTASVFNRESFPGNAAGQVQQAVNSGVTYDGLETFADHSTSSNWWLQGAETRIYQNSEIAAVRILTLEPKSSTAIAPGWTNSVNERLRILGEAPINGDGSFLAKVPADTPITFALIDRGGRTLTMAQTWHQVRPGEMHADCGGCHAHSTTPVSFATSQAAGLPPTDLTLVAAHDVEYQRDIDPIIQRSCVQCHSGSIDTAPARLAFTSDPATNYQRLANDPKATVGYAPPAGQTRWVTPNMSRFVRTMNSSRSLLMWVLSGQRLDGWTNARFPGPMPALYHQTDANRAFWNQAMTDLDFVAGTFNHVPLVTDAERRLFAEWIDLAVPFNSGGRYFEDENRPAIGFNVANTTLTVGAADAYTGVAQGTMSVTVDGSPVSLSVLSEGRWSAKIPAGLHRIVVQVKDGAGNLSALTRTVTITSNGETTPPPPAQPPAESPEPAPAPSQPPPQPLPSVQVLCSVSSVGVATDKDVTITARCDTNGTVTIPAGSTFTLTLQP